ncbi:DoxX family protein [Flavobacterium sp. F-65]|jgi:uncharacterized membrane protein|uniref:DoxX family protein n=1 Tax=Flavobacterium pisciphilum TaxID=2893755 RepID=A0ABS8MVY8_9FLAO|nr:DoxX family protein [Flavobacterium sp. F-65]MCC9072955.1 DoxX family protein [Flavobacterium sp. F-65]
MKKTNVIIYWVSTILLSIGMFSGGIAQLLKAKETVDGIVHLGYPIYFTSIIGTWKVLGVIVLLIPKFALMKEWAYAGFFFAMSGAVFSHVASGDAILNYLAPFVFALLTVVSWYFRPVDRKIITK